MKMQMDNSKQNYLGHEMRGEMKMGVKKMDHGKGKSRHHEMMVADYKKRFWVGIVLTLPILALSPLISNFFGFAEKISFRGDLYVLFVLSSIIYFYCGLPFLKGFFAEIKRGLRG